MADTPAVLFVKPNAISAADKKALQSAGIVVVEIDDPNEVKFVRAATELPMGDILAAAGAAINKSWEAQAAFGKAMASIMEDRRNG